MSSVVGCWLMVVVSIVGCSLAWGVSVGCWSGVVSMFDCGLSGLSVVGLWLVGMSVPVVADLERLKKLADNRDFLLVLFGSLPSSEELLL